MSALDILSAPIPTNTSGNSYGGLFNSKPIPLPSAPAPVSVSSSPSLSTLSNPLPKSVLDMAAPKNTLPAVSNNSLPDSFKTLTEPLPQHVMNMVKTSSMPATPQDSVLGQYPFTDSAREMLKTYNYLPTSFSQKSIVPNQGGQYDSGTKNIFFDNTNPNIPEDQQHLVLAHEMLNALYEKSPAFQNTNEFNSTWDALKESSTDPKVRQLLTDIDNHTTSLGYDKIQNKNVLPSSRFSYLAQDALTEGSDYIPKELRPYYDKLVDFTPKSADVFTSKAEVRKQDWKDVANLPSQLAAQFGPALNGLLSLTTAITGKSPTLNIPNIFQDEAHGGKNAYESNTSQEYYNQLLDQKVDPNTAFWKTALKTVGDMTMLVPVARDVTAGGFKALAPEKLIDPEVVSQGSGASKKEIYDYLSGRTPSAESPIPEPLKRAISDTMQNGTREEKINVLQGLDPQQVLAATPSRLGTLLGISQDEADNILQEVYGGPTREAPAGALPGYTPENPRVVSAGLSTERVTRVGGEYPEIPKDLQPLAEEAKKYKSAEEFVNNQPKLSRGTSDLQKGQIPKEGLSVTIDPSVANKYAKSRGLAGYVEDFYVKPEAKVIRLEDVPVEIRSSGEGSDFAGKAAIWARNNGYDVLDMSAGNEAEMRILNNDIITSKEERSRLLTDFYNKAVGNPSPTPPGEAPKPSPEAAKPTPKAGEGRDLPLEEKPPFGPGSETSPEAKTNQESASAPEAAVGEHLPVNESHVQALERVEQEAERLSRVEDSLRNNPARALARYANKDGELPEHFTSQNTKRLPKSLYGRNADKIVPELGFETPEDAAEAFAEYRTQLETYKQDLKTFKLDKRLATQDFKAGVAANESSKQGLTDEDYKERYADPVITEHNLGVVPPAVRGGLRAPEIDWSTAKDRATIRLGRDTMERNLEKIFPAETAAKLNDFLVEATRQNDLDRTHYVNELRLEIRAKMKELGIKRNSGDDSLVQLFGEGLMKLDQLQAETKNWAAVQSAADYFRKLYDHLIDDWNIKRRQYNYPDVGKRAAYFRHFNEINEWTKLFGVLANDAQLPTSIAGITDNFKPGKSFTTAELHRTGRRTKYSAIGGMDNYLESVGKQMFHIDSIQRGRAVEKYLREAAKASEDNRNPETGVVTPLKLQNFAGNLNEWTNFLAGKSARLDRALESTVGRPALRFAQNVTRLFGKNVIAGNLSSALSHLIPTVFNAATVTKPAYVTGMLDTLTLPLRSGGQLSKIDGVESSFLTRRFPVKYILPTKFQTTEDVLNFIFHTSDQFISRLSVASKYYEAKKQGLSPEEAMKAADNYAQRVVGDRSIGNLPNIMNTKTLGLVTQFQVEINDNLQVLMHDIPKWNEGNRWKIASALTQFAVFSYLFNQVLKKVKGSGKGLDPIDMGLTIMGLTDEVKGQNLLTRLETAGGNLLGELPFTSLVTGDYPVKTALTPGGKALKDLAGGDFSGAAGQGVKFASTFASPVGGGAQALKTIEGITAVERGNTVTAAGKEKTTIPKTPGNFLRGALFGPSALDKANAEATGGPATSKLSGITLTPRNAGGLTLTKNSTLPKIKLVPKSGKKVTSMPSVPNGTKTSSSSIIGRVVAYAKAIGTDPGTAFHDIFSGQTIKAVENGQIIVDRMGLAESSSIKKGLAGDGDVSQGGMILDHIVPLEAGGTNDKSNLQLVSDSADGHDVNQPVEDFLGKALKGGKITGIQAREAAIRFKASQGQPLTPELQKEYKDKYGSKPMTASQIYNLDF